MFFINNIQIPVVSAYNIFPYSEGNTLSISISGYYEQLKEANDNFDTYLSGFNTGTRYFFSGSGYWNGSGYTVAPNFIYLFDTIDSLSTGLYTGGFTLKFLTGNSFRSGYFDIQKYVSGFVLAPASNYFFDTFDSYQTGYFQYSYETGVTPTINFSYGISGLHVNDLYQKSNYMASGGIRTGYFSIFGDTTGYNYKLISNTRYTGSQNSGYWSGYFISNSEYPFISTSGYSGYGNSIIFSGYGGIIPNEPSLGGPGIINYRPTGTMQLLTGALEVRFKRFNAYKVATGINQNFLSGLGNQPIFVNDPFVGIIKTLSMNTGISITQIQSGIGYGQVDSNSNIINSIGDIQNNEWYTISIVSESERNGADQSECSFYVNGLINNTGIVTGSQFLTVDTSSARYISFGGYSSIPSPPYSINQTGKFYGIIDEIRVWNYVRTSGEIYSGWNQTVNPQSSGLAIFLRI